MAGQIGVLTFHRCINYGSYWQARCLVEGLGRLGHDAVLLDHHSARVDRAEWRCALAPVPGNPPDRAYARKVRRFFEAFADLPMSQAFDLDQPGAMPRLDRVLVGSDEVWNLRHPWYGGAPLFFGRGIEGERIAYAASFGNLPATDGLHPDYADLLGGFSAMAVRDHNSRRLVTAALRREPVLVLDPCLAFADRIPQVSGGEPYLAVYGHGFPDWFTTEICSHAAYQGLKIASIGYRNSWADVNWIDAGPADFARFFSGATAVASNFFHGCIFSLVNKKPFVTVASDYRATKISDLLALVGDPARLRHEGGNPSDFRHLLATPPEPAVQHRIAALRQVSLDYLTHALA